VHNRILQGEIMRIPFHFPVRRSAVLFALTLLLSVPALFAQDLKPILLPKPQTTGGKPLLTALNERQTSRTFENKPLPPQVLSNLLWAAFGVNRSPEVKPGYGHTAPSAGNKQEVQLYVLLADGVYTYDSVANVLKPVAAGDARGKVGTPAQASAPVTIAYVADVKTDKFNGVDTGFIGQNVYLFAASEGLGAWFHAIHGDDAATALNLTADQHLLYAQAVGYPGPNATAIPAARPAAK
jgi:nitroreductase